MWFAGNTAKPVAVWALCSCVRPLHGWMRPDRRGDRCLPCLLSNSELNGHVRPGYLSTYWRCVCSLCEANNAGRSAAEAQIISALEHWSGTVTHTPRQCVRSATAKALPRASHSDIAIQPASHKSAATVVSNAPTIHYRTVAGIISVFLISIKLQNERC